MFLKDYLKLNILDPKTHEVCVVFGHMVVPEDQKWKGKLSYYFIYF